MNALHTHFSAQSENILDLVISNVPHRIQNLETQSPEEAGLSTDHHLVELDIIGHLRRIKKPERSVYKFKEADLNQSSRIIECRDCSNVNTYWVKWKSAVLDIIDSHVPKIKLKDKNTPP